MRQRLIDRVNGDIALNTGCDVEIDLGVARQCKQYLLCRNIGYDDAVSFNFNAWFGWQEWNAAVIRAGYFSVALCRRDILCLKVPV